MRIKSIHLTNYKRFTDLLIDHIPESARLIVMVGPNGTGKSSIFDAFLLKSHGPRRNYALDGQRGGYYLKNDDLAQVPTSTSQVSENVNVQFYGDNPTGTRWPSVFNIRSPYRSEADFQLSNLERVRSASESERFGRIIDLDQAVSDNYKRMTWKRMMDLDSDAPGDTTFEKYRRESLGELQRALKRLFAKPTLQLQDFGGLSDLGVFRFSKGTSKNFHYKNLSGGKGSFRPLIGHFCEAVRV